ncbi:MAG: hypothetical protein AMJ79_03490 [Phycisphaerae bacterium SM23_30]|nr:MAG: hypothetical protein AMJ79_03490 [Phycisphaerae bacterium SM23_30]
MTFGKLIFQNLRYYWRTHLGVMLGAALSTAILTGALLIGDSVSYSLNRQALARLGETQLALVGQDRFFRSKLAGELADKLQTAVAPVLQLNGLLINRDTEKTARSNQVQVLGVDKRFWELADGKPITIDNDQVILNEPLAAQLKVEAGDQVRLRVARPELLSRDAPLSLDRDISIEQRLTIKTIVSEEQFGRFGLQADQVMPMNAWVSLPWLAERVELKEKANMLLVGGEELKNIPLEAAQTALQQCWQLADASLELRQLKQQKILELRSGRIFLEEPIVEAAVKADPSALEVLTYFVNEIRLGERATPYSIVSSLRRPPTPPDATTATAPASTFNQIVPSDMRDDEIIVNQWLADDLQGRVGDSVDLTYFVFGPMRRLQEQTSRFRIRAIIPLTQAAADRELMPDFPGLAQVENCRDWKPGIDIDIGRIRPKDEDYWDLYRGTPKAFISLRTAQKMWANRFGNLTAVRYSLTDGIKDRIEQALKTNLNPAAVGLFFQPVRQRALTASRQAQDMEWIFLGLSFFIIAAALGLMGLLFVFGIEQRHKEIGALLAMGFTRQKVRQLFLLEGIILAGLGALLGIAGSIIYTRLMIYCLSTAWQGAISGARINYHADNISFIIGVAAGLCVAVSAMWITLRRQGRQQVRQLLEGTAELLSLSGRRTPGKARAGYVLAAATAAAALLLLIFTGLGNKQHTAAAFFGAGALLLIAAMALSHGILSQSAGTTDNLLVSLANFAFRNAGRRRGRSLAVIALLACGSFLVFAVGANRRNPLAHAQQRRSGTGGFTLLAESTLPVLHDLNLEEGRRKMGLISPDLALIKVVQMRLRQGDDASCLNLNRPQTPRLLGVQPQELAAREAFDFVKTIEGKPDLNPWLLLKQPQTDHAVPAFADDTTIEWALDKRLGDTLSYINERGRTFNVRLVGALKNSILQGSLVISEEALMQQYPSEQGYRVFLIDVPPPKTEAVTQAFLRLQGTNRDIGLRVTKTQDRLAALYEMQSTYLTMFQLLGGLGMMLGIAGLALVVLRNVMERRGELAMLRAVGFNKGSLTRLLLYEHWWLVILGLAAGVVAALVAVMPAVRSAGGEIPFASLALILAAMLISGILWVWLAARLATQGPLLDALRHE